MANLLRRDASTAQAETVLDAVLNAVGRQALGAFIQERVDRADAARKTPATMTREGRRPVWVRSLWGDVQIRRAYYSAVGGGEGWAPGDALIGGRDGCTPALCRALSVLAAQMPFAAGASLLKRLTGATVDARYIQRFAGRCVDELAAWVDHLPATEDPCETLYIGYDGTGTPMRKECLVGRSGRDPEAGPKTREMRLGCVFTQTAVDAEGRPVRDADSTTYVAGLLPVDRFGPLIKAEARRRGYATARRVVILSDGAKWCKTIAEDHFPGATFILDFYHAAEHLHQLALARYGPGSEADEVFHDWCAQMRDGRIAEILDSVIDSADQADDAEALHKELAYLSDNAARMQYNRYRAAGLFIGSGVVEAGCKTVVGHRTKHSGMHWGEAGVQAVVTLRCALLSNRLDAFWDHVLAQPRAA